MANHASQLQELRAQLLRGAKSPRDLALRALARANQNAGRNVYISRDENWTLREADRVHRAEPPAWRAYSRGCCVAPSRLCCGDRGPGRRDPRGPRPGVRRRPEVRAGVGCRRKQTSLAPREAWTSFVPVVLIYLRPSSAPCILSTIPDPFFLLARPFSQQSRRLLSFVARGLCRRRPPVFSFAFAFTLPVAPFSIFLSVA